jgi:hypothetical protein
MPAVIMESYRRSLARAAVADIPTRDQRVAEVSALLREIAGHVPNAEGGLDLPNDLNRALEAWLAPRSKH